MSPLTKVPTALRVTLLLAAGAILGIVAYVAIVGAPQVRKFTTSDPSTGTVAKVTCPTLGFNPSPSSIERVTNCTNAGRIQRFLLERGATSALVTVATRTSPKSVRPPQNPSVTVTITAPTAALDTWDRHGLGMEVARMAGTTPNHVFISDQNGAPLFNGSRPARTTPAF